MQCIIQVFVLSCIDATYLLFYCGLCTLCAVSANSCGYLLHATLAVALCDI
jgi:hypothetical protein